MYDTACSVSTISYDLVKELKLKFIENVSKIMLANKSLMTSMGWATFKLTIGSISKMISVKVTENLCSKMLLGMDVINVFDLEQRSQGVVTMCNIPVPSSHDHCAAAQSFSNAFVERQFSVYQEIQNVLDQNIDLFHGVGCTDVSTFKIITKSDDIIRHRVQRLPVHLIPKLVDHVESLLADNIIELSQSEFRNRIVPIIKKNGEVRLAIDFRDLNRITKKDSNPMPNIEEALLDLSESKVYSKLDLTKGFYQISLDTNSREKTAFVLKDKLYQFKRLPFGLTNAPIAFQQMMQEVLKGFNFVKIFLDDVIIFSESIQQHKDHLRLVLKRIRDANLRLNAEKCVFGVDEVTYLGYKIKNGHRSASDDKLNIITKFGQPKDKKQLIRFIGLIGFYRKLIKNCGTILKPLYEVYNLPGKKFKWDEACQRSFEKLKNIFENNPPLLKIPNPKYPFIVVTDASADGMGGTLLQLIDGAKVVVDYFSRSFNSTQRKYSTYEREATALMAALRKWRHFLIGRPFHIEVDHKALCWLLSKHDCEGKLGRWVLELQEFDIVNIKHIAGKDNI